MADEFCLKMPNFHVTFRYRLHSVNLRHGTDGFTSPPKEGVLRIFSPWKIQRLRSGLNPQTWVPNASTLPLDHWSRMKRPFARLSSTWRVSYPEKVLFNLVAVKASSYTYTEILVWLYRYILYAAFTHLMNIHFFRNSKYSFTHSL